MEDKYYYYAAALVVVIIVEPVYRNDLFLLSLSVIPDL